MAFASISTGKATNYTIATIAFPIACYRFPGVLLLDLGTSPTPVNAGRLDLAILKMTFVSCVFPRHACTQNRQAIRQLRIGHQEIGSSAMGARRYPARLAVGAVARGAMAVGALALGLARHQPAS